MPGGFSHTGSDTASLKHPVPGAHIPFSFPSLCQETPIQHLLLLPQTCISTARPKIKKITLSSNSLVSHWNDAHPSRENQGKPPNPIHQLLTPRSTLCAAHQAEG